MARAIVTGWFAVVVLAGCVARSGVPPAAEIALTAPSRQVEPDDQPGSSEIEPPRDGTADMTVRCVADVPPVSATANEARRWVIDQAEAQQEQARLDVVGDDSCAAGSVEAQVCRALWLASILDPVAMWLADAPQQDRTRAATVVDRSLASAGDTSGHEVLADFRIVTDQLVDSIQWGDEAIADALVERNDPVMIDELRALERGCLD